MKTVPSEVHLWPARLSSGSGSGSRAAGAGFAALRLPNAPVSLVSDADRPAVIAWDVPGAASGVGLEPFRDARNQLRLLAHFPQGTAPLVNGEAAPCLAVLSPGDFFQIKPGFGFKVALFCRPQIGPPPAGIIGKPCLFCRVPFAASAITYACGCGAVLHCESDPEQGLQCAQMNQVCPVCKRPIVLKEGYVTTPDEE